MPITVTQSTIPGVMHIRPLVHHDDRGWFSEVFKAGEFARAGIADTFAQDNVSWSAKRGTLRGLHFQEPRAQGKLVQVFRGAVWDVAVDVRKGSPHFGAWVGVELSEENRRQLWIPPGFAHGFCVLSDVADFFYKCTDLYAPECQRAVRWDDPDLAIRWQVQSPLISPRDQAAPSLAESPMLPVYRTP